MKKRKIYSKEFKLEALRQWEQGGQSARAVASSLGLPRSALYKWKEQLSEQGEEAFQGLGCRPAGPPAYTGGGPDCRPLTHPWLIFAARIINQN